MTRDIAKQIEAAEDCLIALDQALGNLIKLQRPVVYLPRSDYFYSLCRSIVGQQISMAAATAIFGRLDAASQLKPDKVAKLSENEMRAIGLSKQKIMYIRDLAEHFVKNPGIYNHLERATDDEVITELTEIKGIGTWSAQMFLMFTLVRFDVFAPDDVGLQRAMKSLYKWDSVPNRRTLEQKAEAWRPYRTVASWHLWKSLNNTPGQLQDDVSQKER